MCGVQTIGYDPMTGADEGRKIRVELMTLDKLWPQADYITLHTPLIPQTKREKLPHPFIRENNFHLV